MASRYGSFPIMLETYRECLQDVFDLPALQGVLAAHRAARDRAWSASRRRRASPFASSLMFDYIASYMYEGDAPLADRRAQALALDRDLLRELLGAEELRELLDAGALAELELELQSLTAERAAGSADQVHDLLRRLGDLTADEVAARVRGADERARRAAAGEWLEALGADRRAVQVRHRRRASAGSPSRTWRATAMRLACSRRPACRRHSSTPVPDALAWVARALGAAPRPVPGHRARGALGRAGRPGRGRTGARCSPTGTLLRGEFRPGGVEREWCHPDVLRAPAPPLAGPAAPRDRAGRAGGAGALPAQLAGRRRCGAAASTDWPRSSPSSRACRCRPACSSATSCRRAFAGYSPRLLDELGAAGEVVWVAPGSLGKDDGRVALYRPDQLPMLLPTASGRRCSNHLGPRRHSRAPGESRRLVLPRPAGGCPARAPAGERAPSERELLDALWDLVWSGEVTNDTFAPLRALRWPRSDRRRRNCSVGRPFPRRQPARPARGRRALVAGDGRHLDRTRAARGQGSL